MLTRWWAERGSSHDRGGVGTLNATSGPTTRGSSGRALNVVVADPPHERPTDGHVDDQTSHRHKGRPGSVSENREREAGYPLPRRLSLR
jgi:hypothetical protein